MAQFNPLRIEQPGASDNPLIAGAPTAADAYDYNTSAVGQWLAVQRAKSAQMGLWNDQSGMPTGAGVVDAAGQYTNALMMGTTAPGARGAMDNPAFAKWFGKSQVVDEAGNPAVAYHGTADSISEFRHDQPHAKDSGWLGKGFYFWNQPRLAGDYASMKAGDAPNIIPAHLKLENPYYATSADKARLMIQLHDGNRAASADFTAELQAKGHDGVILAHPDGLKEIMVFTPEQIKSAIGNRGTYDPRDPRITYGAGGLMLGGGAAAGAQGNGQQ